MPTRFNHWEFLNLKVNKSSSCCLLQQAIILWNNILIYKYVYCVSPMHVLHNVMWYNMWSFSVGIDKLMKIYIKFIIICHIYCITIYIRKCYVYVCVRLCAFDCARECLYSTSVYVWGMGASICALLRERA